MRQREDFEELLGSEDVGNGGTKEEEENEEEPSMMEVAEEADPDSSDVDMGRVSDGGESVINSSVDEGDGPASSDLLSDGMGVVDQDACDAFHS